jgi:hypothetical protein
MSFAVVHSRALDALQAQAVTVEVHLANGLPSFTLVGLADTEVKESRDAQKNIGCRDMHRETVDKKTRSTLSELQSQGDDSVIGKHKLSSQM